MDYFLGLVSQTNMDQIKDQISARINGNRVLTLETRACLACMGYCTTPLSVLSGVRIYAGHCASSPRKEYIISSM